MTYERQGTSYDPGATGHELQGRDKLPIVHLLTTNLTSLTADISVNGVTRTYNFLTAREIDTLRYLFTISGLKALNYAKKHSESSTMVEA